MIEKKAKGTKGFLLKGFKGNHFFRIYKGSDFTDYDLLCEELEVEILSDWYSFYEKEKEDKVDHNFLDWSSKALGRENKNV